MQIEQFEGCMVGHAIGDALGAPVEFMSRKQILAAHGVDGVHDMVAWSTPRHAFLRGSYTDDTQMAIATALGVLEALEISRAGGLEDIPGTVQARYLSWLEAQTDPRQERYPGATCIGALSSGQAGCVDDPINDRKGSGGIMRVSPIGLVERPERAFETAAEVAALTHGHPTGFLSAGVFADVVSRVVRGSGVFDAVAETREFLVSFDDYDETLAAVDQAVELYVSDVHPVEAVQLIGEGWVAEEALGIALLCALSYPNDWPRATLAAVNITGDSDTTGALTGALAGAALGIDEIPAGWVDDVEDSAMLLDLSARLLAVATP